MTRAAAHYDGGARGVAPTLSLGTYDRRALLCSRHRTDPFFQVVYSGLSVSLLKVDWQSPCLQFDCVVCGEVRYCGAALTLSTCDTVNLRIQSQICNHTESDM